MQKTESTKSNVSNKKEPNEVETTVLDLMATREDVQECCD